MISGIGTDIVELEKINRYSRQESFLNKVFTKREIEYCKSNGIEHFATTFAAKEAIFKALGTGWLDGKEIEIIRNKRGRPNAVINGNLKKILNSKDIMLSLSYTKSYAVAFAIIKKKKK